MIILITGGQRSGKSVEAEKMALQMAERPIYLATSIPMDDDFRERVRIHQARRGDRWINIEEPIHLSNQNDTIKGKTVLVDCITLWLTNIFFMPEIEEDKTKALDFAIKELDKFLRCNDTTYILVTNEIGLGGTSMNRTQRHFTDLQGSINQHLASLADKVTLMISGIPVKIK